MRKSLSRNLYLIGIVIAIIGLALYIYAATQVTGFTVNPDGTTSGTPSLSSAGAIASLIAIGLFVVASILTFVAWVGALIKTAQLQRWGWFVCLIVFNGITMLIYVFAGPETSKAAVPARVG